MSLHIPFSDLMNNFFIDNQDRLNWVERNIGSYVDYVHVNYDEDAVLKKLADNYDDFVAYVKQFNISCDKLTPLIGDTCEDVTIYCLEKTKDYKENEARQLEINCIKAIIGEDILSFNLNRSKLSAIYEYLTETSIIPIQLQNSINYKRMKSVELQDKYFIHIASIYNKKEFMHKIINCTNSSDESSDSSDESSDSSDSLFADMP
jgi:hypothetical protein